MKQIMNKDEDAERFNKNNRRLEESPTSQKLKNTFILQNSDSSFDKYAVMMKKRKILATQSQMGASVDGMTNHSSLKKFPTNVFEEDMEQKMRLNINQVNP